MKKDIKELEPEISRTSGNGSVSRTSEEAQSLAIQTSASRTELGKQRASQNAIKHGVFSKVVVLPNESRAEYERMLAGLREAIQPEGELEELLVEKLASTVWRQRRLLSAEAAEIRRNAEFVESDQRDRHRKEAETVGNLSRFASRFGLIQEIHIPDVLERCVELLAELREQIERKGFDPESDKGILVKVYGDRDENRLRDDLCDSYDQWLNTAGVSEEERMREGYASPGQCQKNVMKEIEQEIGRLKRYQKARTSIESVRTQLEIQRRNVPDAAELDRLLRYEASLERSFDRTLTQLERLQRIRRGQPVLPKIEVHHSLS